MIGREKRRIGFILATVHTGSSLKVWSHMADFAEKNGDVFFVFPGGKLDYKNGTDNLRNSIFPLANKTNLDGLVCWSSAIGSSVTSEELRRFHSEFEGLPFVTIGAKIEGHPCVWFDAYSGMQTLAEHFIKEHNCSKIAYLRGPQNHASAQDRYIAFEDVLAEYNLYNEQNLRLVSDPHNWDDGLLAVKQLCEERKLVPGKDFDALIASSDMMAMAAYNYFAAQGIKVPDDVRIGGFNDSEESRICEVPFTTVHMPEFELGDIAGKMIYQLLQGSETIEDTALSVQLVVRQSCGCTVKGTRRVETVESILKENIKEQYYASRLQLVLNRLKLQLMTVRTRKALVEQLALYLPQLGIESASFVMYKDDSLSECIGHFSRTIVNSEPEFFPSERLFPAGLEAQYARGAFIVQPLFIENQPLGYFITSYAHFSGGIYEDLRATISNTLQSIVMFEEINAAKRLAEQAEYSKTEFFANVGNDLCDPLRELELKIGQLGANIESSSVERDILLEQVLFIKSQIQAQREKTETLVDLTRSQVDDLPMDKKLFDIRDALPKKVAVELQGELPLLYGDPVRLAKALAIIAEESLGTFSVTAEPCGMRIYLECNRLNWQQPTLLLAEKIILLQYGEVTKTDTSCTIMVQWPNLACQPVLKAASIPASIYSLSPVDGQETLWGIPVQDLPDSLSDFRNVQNSSGALLWYPDTVPIDEWVKVHGLRNHPVLFKMPIICYSKELAGHTFIEGIELKIRTQQMAPVLFVHTKFQTFGSWATEQNSVSISSIDEFDAVLTEITPSLIVFDRVDEAAIKKIRRTPNSVLIPIIVLPETMCSESDVELLCAYPRIVLCNKGAAESEQFSERIKGILSGDEILPPHTGALVKRAVLYLNQNASSQIVRWKLADFVHVSEDYLTRIFHRELGLSLWEYLNRYRVYLATKMLLETNDTIYEIAENSGFQDQAYFCRVFKKIYGVPPGKIRSK